MQSSCKDNCIQHSFLNLYFFIASRTKNRTSGAVQHTPISTPIPHGKVGVSAVCQTANAVNITAVERRMSAMRSRTRRYTSARQNADDRHDPERSPAAVAVDLAVKIIVRRYLRRELRIPHGDIHDPGKKNGGGGKEHDALIERFPAAAESVDLSSFHNCFPTFRYPAPAAYPARRKHTFRFSSAGGRIR